MNEPTEELTELRAQRDDALAKLDIAIAEQDKIATGLTALNADSSASASYRGRAGGVYYAREIVRAAFGLE